MLELSRILTSAGLVAASVGLTVYGMAVSYYDSSSVDLEIGRWMMILGTIATVIGAVMYGKTWNEARDD